MSVLEASATKRDAKGYLQKYTSKDSKTKAESAPLARGEPHPQQQPGTHPKQDLGSRSESAHVALIKLRCPQYLDQDTIIGVARTLSQLRVLGLLSVVVLDCGADENRETFGDQALNLCEALDSFSKPGCKLLEDIVVGHPHGSLSSPSIVGNTMRVDDLDRLKRALQHGLIPVVPSVARRNNASPPRPVDADQFVLTITKYLSGMQFASPGDEPSSAAPETAKPRKIASVERVIILDPLGGTPVPGRPGTSQRFVNLEQEYDTLLRHLMGPEGSPLAHKDQCSASATIHASNLHLAKEALSILPSSSSVVITTPLAAASTHFIASGASKVSSPNQEVPQFGFNGMVTTRKRQNPLLHNLLTDKPVYSSSLPVKRIQDSGYNVANVGPSSAATLVKRGMPLTIFPDPRIQLWAPPKPGGSRLRLTDNCIDLPRLVYLIENSFGRKLDVQDYLNRVNENLAGIIIAGEYEGGAILTWEQPQGLDQQTAYEQGRLVPYLDKFAVLKSRQGSGGVADIVFNAMVGDCFPDGVCWRSRKDNPVNKWYFERSVGTSKLDNSNWTMFWTTLGLDTRHPTMRDYESVCRNVEPSWSDKKNVVD